MTSTEPTESVAAVCESDTEDVPLLRAYLAAQGITDAVWCHPRQIGKLDRAVGAGRVRRVVFPRLEVFLECLWAGALSVQRWQATAPQVEFAGAQAASTQACAQTVMAAWQRFHRRRRRRQAAAGLILSAAAAGAAFLILLVSR